VKSSTKIGEIKKSAIKKGPPAQTREALTTLTHLSLKTSLFNNHGNSGGVDGRSHNLHNNLKLLIPPQRLL
jgi:hypothetical protein